MTELLDADELEFGPKLAEGGAAIVFAGEYQFAPVAIKKVKHMASDEAGRMMGEAAIMKKLRHPNIVHFYALAIHEGSVCLVMELMAGGSFRDVLDDIEEGNRTMGLKQKLKIMKDTCIGLAYLHNLKPLVIHRDLKAANILIDENLTAKLTDFGISRMKQGAQQVSMQPTNGSWRSWRSWRSIAQFTLLDDTCMRLIYVLGVLSTYCFWSASAFSRL
jgi:serine/threonine protein kinase